MTPAQKSYFDNHPDTQELHFTSDGLPFFQKHDAEAHAAGLADKEVRTIERNEALEFEHEVTQGDLDLNPELAEQGVQVGETIMLPAESDLTPEEEEAAARELQEKLGEDPAPAAPLTPAQKAAATRAANKAAAEKTK